MWTFCCAKHFLIKSFGFDKFTLCTNTNVTEWEIENCLGSQCSARNSRINATLFKIQFQHDSLLGGTKLWMILLEEIYWTEVNTSAHFRHFSVLSNIAINPLASAIKICGKKFTFGLALCSWTQSQSIQLLSMAEGKVNWKWKHRVYMFYCTWKNKHNGERIGFYTIAINWVLLSISVHFTSCFPHVHYSTMQTNGRNKNMKLRLTLWRSHKLFFLLSICSRVATQKM